MVIRGRVRDGRTKLANKSLINGYSWPFSGRFLNQSFYWELPIILSFLFFEIKFTHATTKTSFSSRHMSRAAAISLGSTIGACEGTVLGIGRFSEARGLNAL